MANMRLVASLAVSVALAVALHPSWSPINPATYFAPTAPGLEGPYAPKLTLTSAVRIFSRLVKGPEDVIADADGNLYCSNSDGEIKKLWMDGTVTTWARVGGRPLGLEWMEEGKSLLVCAADKGLLLAQEDGTVSVLSNSSDGRPFRMADNLDVSADKQRVYFSDASDAYGPDEFEFDILEARPHGRLLLYDTATKETETLLDGLYFANGVALSQNEDFVLVSETPRYQITRYFLKGERAGTSDVFIDNLPGFPDNIKANRQGTFWVALAWPRLWTMDLLHRFPMVKALLPRIPKWIWHHFEEAGLVLALNETGHAVRLLADPKGTHVKQITTARQHGSELLIGTLEGDAVFKVALEAG